MVEIIILLAARFLAFSNGANDNFKGVFTLFGTGTALVSVGGIFGIGVVNKKANYKMISKILGSWILTLPMAAILAVLIFFIFHNVL